MGSLKSEQLLLTVMSYYKNKSIIYTIFNKIHFHHALFFTWICPGIYKMIFN
jgi:hypothetical protein